MIPSYGRLVPVATVCRLQDSHRPQRRLVAMPRLPAGKLKWKAGCQWTAETWGGELGGRGASLRGQEAKGKGWGLGGVVRVQDARFFLNIQRGGGDEGSTGGYSG